MFELKTGYCKLLYAAGVNLHWHQDSIRLRFSCQPFKCKKDSRCVYITAHENGKGLTGLVIVVHRCRIFHIRAAMHLTIETFLHLCSTLEKCHNLSFKVLNPRELQYSSSAANTVPPAFSFLKPCVIVGIQGKPLLCQSLALKCCGLPHVICIFVRLSAPGRQNLTCGRTQSCFGGGEVSFFSKAESVHIVT